MVHVARCDHGGAEASRDADRHPLLAQHAGHLVGAAEAVLDGDDDGVRSEQRPRALGGLLDVPRLGRDDDEVDGAGLSGVGRRLEANGPIPARALHAQPLLADRVDVLSPGVDRPDLVSPVGEQPGVHRAHRADADDCYLHAAPDR